MSSLDSPLHSSLERLNLAVEDLDISLGEISDISTESMAVQNVIDVDFMAKRLDRAIETVEMLLLEGE